MSGQHRLKPAGGDVIDDLVGRQLNHSQAAHGRSGQ